MHFACYMLEVKYYYSQELSVNPKVSPEPSIIYIYYCTLCYGYTSTNRILTASQYLQGTCSMSNKQTYNTVSPVT